MQARYKQPEADDEFIGQAILPCVGRSIEARALDLQRTTLARWLLSFQYLDASSQIGRDIQILVIVHVAFGIVEIAALILLIDKVKL